jgi:AraC-like DNA-binding protein
VAVDRIVITEDHTARLETRIGQGVRNQFSYTEQISLAWARNLLVAMSGLYLLYFVDNFFSDALGLDEKIGDLLMLMMVVMIYTMGYLGLRQPVIFSRLELNSNETVPRKEVESPQAESVTRLSAGEKYKKSALDAETSNVFLAELEKEMEINKPYLDGDLTLPQLAKRLSISPNYLSQIINEQLKRNFFDFVNRYRVEEAKGYLLDPDKQRENVLTLALDAGFNSKSAFYTAFKKHTGMTPGQFKNSLRAV